MEHHVWKAKEERARSIKGRKTQSMSTAVCKRPPASAVLLRRTLIEKKEEKGKMAPNLPNFPAIFSSASPQPKRAPLFLYRASSPLASAVLCAGIPVLLLLYAEAAWPSDCWEDGSDAGVEAEEDEAPRPRPRPRPWPRPWPRPRPRPRQLPRPPRQPPWGRGVWWKAGGHAKGEKAREEEGEKRLHMRLRETVEKKTIERERGGEQETTRFKGKTYRSCQRSRASWKTRARRARAIKGERKRREQRERERKCKSTGSTALECADSAAEEARHAPAGASRRHRSPYRRRECGTDA